MLDSALKMISKGWNAEGLLEGSTEMMPQLAFDSTEDLRWTIA